MSDLLGIGSSGVGAYQRALATVSNNIANVSTEGYTRQDVSLTANQPRLMGGSYLGTGARFDNVQRQYDAFVESNLRNSNSELASQKPLLSYVNRLIDVMGDESVGLRGMTQAIASFNFVNTDHLVHLRDLKIISDQYSLNIVDATHKVRSGQLSWADAQKKLAQARSTVKEKWAAHPTDDFVGEELKLVTSIEEAFAKLEEPLNKLQKLFEKENQEALSEFVEKELYEDIDTVVEQLSLFIDAQLVEANSEFEAAEATFEFNRNLTIAIVLAGLLGGLWLALSIIRSITQPLAQVQKWWATLKKRATSPCALMFNKAMKSAARPTPSTA